jgi:methionyl-tRNA synthetase
VTAERGTFYLTTPIYYVNATPHLGHAYTTIVADAMTRYHRLAGDRVWFLTGTDEHGDKIAQAAARANVAPKAYADRIADAFRQTWDRLGIRYDDFIRTTEPRHVAVVQRILQILWDAGQIYLGKYGGQYCFGCERFYTEKEIVDGRCPDHQTPLTYIEEENYFFRMSRYQEWLIGYIEAHPDLIRPERYRNEILGFLRDPLQDLSISRPRTRLEWGIPLPFDDRFVTYVWFDALINYVSALGFPDGERFRTFWPHAQHVIGKDILKPHAVYWPTMLKGVADAMKTPVEALMYQRLNVHGYWNVGGGKMSKSVGNVVEALALTDTYGHDAYRYFLMREMPFGLDADFSEESLVGRLNADLANDLGNLVSRATTLIVNNGGIVRVPEAGELSAEERTIVARVERVRTAVDEAMDEFAFHRALAAIWEFVGLLNGYVDAMKPWDLAKDPARRPVLERVLYVLAESLRILGIILAPFVPEAAGKIRHAVGEIADPSLDDVVWGRLPAGRTIHRLSGLFPRVLPGGAPGGAGARGGAAAGASRARTGRGASDTSGPSARVPIAEFAKIELRVAEVLAAEPVPKSKKLLKLTVSLGAEQRTVVAGIAEHYAAGDLVGKKIVVVANLEPATLMGVESQGMLLAGSVDDRLAVLTIDRDLPPGARVK